MGIPVRILRAGRTRPRRLRQLDQIYMGRGDMVLQSELVAHWTDGKRLAFIGDGDAFGICVGYLQQRGLIDYGPSKIVVFDFDERICGAVERFAHKERFDQLQAQLYNCRDAFPDSANFDYFYMNPPWGANNEGTSVRSRAPINLPSFGCSDECVRADRYSFRSEWNCEMPARWTTKLAR